MDLKDFLEYKQSQNRASSAKDVIVNYKRADSLQGILQKISSLSNTGDSTSDSTSNSSSSSNYIAPYNNPPNPAKINNVLSNIAVITVDGKERFVCPDVSCGKTFSFRCNLKRHYVTHTGQKPFLCDMCGKKFSRKDDMKMHMRIHSTDRPYGCVLKTCDLAYTRLGDLRAHQKKHSALELDLIRETEKLMGRFKTKSDKNIVKSVEGVSQCYPTDGDNQNNVRRNSRKRKSITLLSSSSSTTECLPTTNDLFDSDEIAQPRFKRSATVPNIPIAEIAIMNHDATATSSSRPTRQRSNAVSSRPRPNIHHERASSITEISNVPQVDNINPTQLSRRYSYAGDHMIQRNGNLDHFNMSGMFNCLGGNFQINKVISGWNTSAPSSPAIQTTKGEEPLTVNNDLKESAQLNKYSDNTEDSFLEGHSNSGSAAGVYQRIPILEELDSPVSREKSTSVEYPLNNNPRIRRFSSDDLSDTFRKFDADITSNNNIRDGGELKRLAEDLLNNLNNNEFDAGSLETDIPSLRVNTDRNPSSLPTNFHQHVYSPMNLLDSPTLYSTLLVSGDDENNSSSNNTGSNNTVEDSNSFDATKLLNLDPWTDSLMLDGDHHGVSKRRRTSLESF